MNLEDQRVIRTRQMLQASFITLVNENGYDAVSIRDVTDHAGISYRTFFRHYKDTRELLEDALAEFLDNVTQMLVPADSLDKAEQNLITTFQSVDKKNAELFRAYCRSPFFEESERMQAFSQKVSRNLFTDLQIPSGLVQTHFYYSMMNMLRWWVLNDMPVSAEHMGRYAHDLIVRPILMSVDTATASN